MLPRIVHEPTKHTNNIFPKDWRTRQSQDSYIRSILPYYSVARKAGLQKQFLEVVYPVWFDRFPVTVESDDPYDLSWAIDQQQDFLAKELCWIWAGRKMNPPTDYWGDVINLEADRACRHAQYYKCREIGFHLDEHQYLDTIENEKDRLPISPEESMNAWVEAMTKDGRC